jgi:ankyrin repeat protein
LDKEREQHQKRWDDLLLKCAAALLSGDLLHKIEKLVENAEKDFGFDVNYVSGVVCERNSILNLAVIHNRHKVARWLVESKQADIETYDRGNFTPLLNAAWGGDRTMVRYFLQRGANRRVRGTQHYSQAIAPAGFEGMTADEWAAKNDYPDIAKLIRLGL